MYGTPKNSHLINYICDHYATVELLMEEKSYQFARTRTEFRYEFSSVSVEKEVKKVVLFTETSSSDVFNLALLDDLGNGNYSDITESNNNDLITIMATIFKIVDDFLNTKPNSFVIFRGSDIRRQRLYRIIISRELAKIQEKFEVRGIIDNEMVIDFVPNKPVDYFVINLKQ